MNENESACRYIQLYGNKTVPAPKDLYISCPFSNESYESIPYQLDYLVTGERYKYSKRYIFNVPAHKFIGKYLKQTFFIKWKSVLYFDNDYDFFKSILL